MSASITTSEHVFAKQPCDPPPRLQSELRSTIAYFREKLNHSQGQISAQGILHLRNPNLGPNSAKRILDARISDPNSWVEFFGPIFSRKRGFQGNN